MPDIEDDPLEAVSVSRPPGRHQRHDLPYRGQVERIHTVLERRQQSGALRRAFATFGTLRVSEIVWINVYSTSTVGD